MVLKLASPCRVRLSLDGSDMPHGVRLCVVFQAGGSGHEACGTLRYAASGTDYMAGMRIMP